MNVLNPAVVRPAAARIAGAMKVSSNGLPDEVFERTYSPASVMMNLLRKLDDEIVLQLLGVFMRPIDDF